LFLSRLRAKKMDTTNFDFKFNKVTEIFREWMPEEYDFSNATILDFGCDYGIMTLAIALKLKPKRIIGVDINSHHLQLLEMVKDKIDINTIPDNLEFYEVKPDERLSKRFRPDCIFTWSALEHVSQPYLHKVVAEMYKALKPHGMVFLQIAPLYYSAFGSHLDSLIDTPWAHLLMQNNLLHYAVMSAPKNNLYINEDDQNYEAIKKEIWGCYSTLNKITADGIVGLFETNGFKVLKQSRTNGIPKPPRQLASIFLKEILETEQIRILFKKTP
jgi:SAM-dependent methyltransferase